MAEKPSEIITGGLVLAVAAGFMVYLGQSSGVSGQTGSYDLTASFRSAQGITIGTDVRLAGVKVGTVTALDLNPETYRADVTFAVQDAVKIPEDSSIAVSSEGLLGGNFVELVPGGSPFNLDPGGEIEDTQGALSLLGLLAQFVSSSSED